MSPRLLWSSDQILYVHPGRVSKYMNKISGPLLDRIDSQVEIEPVAFDDIADKAPAESSVSIRDRVMKARTIQQEIP